jgi:phosphate/sulfate permease
MRQVRLDLAVDCNLFIEARYTWKYGSKFFIAGALLGGCWNLWWNVWSYNGTDQSVMTYATGYAIFLSAAAAMVNPRYFTYGAVGGFGLGN